MHGFPPRSRLALALACAALGLTIVPAGAQTPPSIVVPPAKPGAKAPAKAAKAEPKTLGGKGNASGKMLTRDELRQCLGRLDGINAKTKELETQRTALDAERADLAKEGDALKGEREEIERRLAAVREWEGRVRAQGAGVEAFNKKSAGLADAPRGERETLQAELETDRKRLTANREALAAEEARLVPAYQESVKTYNAKAEARDAKVGDWNKRNGAVNEANLKHDESRSAWLTECANRPYREDDEIAIKQGK